MAKFHDKPYTFKQQILEGIETRFYNCDGIYGTYTTKDLVTQIEEWKNKYPNKKLAIEVSRDSYDHDFDGLNLVGTWTESSEDVEKRRQEWLLQEKTERQRRYQEQKERKKIQEEYDRKEYARLQRKYGAKAI